MHFWRVLLRSFSFFCSFPASKLLQLVHTNINKPLLPMPIDYSKWDRIELLDDSDVEVHPNVDKASFIRWKQRDIHDKRQQRNFDIKSILIQLTMYSKLNQRVDKILDTLLDSQLVENTDAVLLVNQSFDPKEKFDYDALKNQKGSNLRKGLRDLTFDREEYENMAPYNEMIEDLLSQIRDDHEDAKHDGSVLRKYLKEHRAKIDDVLLKQTIRLDELLNEKAQLITNDDIHTGFDHTFMNKNSEKNEPNDIPAPVDKEAKTTPKSDSSSSRKTSIKSPQVSEPSELSSVVPTSQSAQAVAESPADELDALRMDDATQSFGKINSNDLRASGEFLAKHLSICNEQQKDALLMSAFDAQLEGNTKRAYQIVHQALLLQYVAQLAGPHAGRDQATRAAHLFTTKVQQPGPAKEAFMADVQNTYNHIVGRCEVIAAEAQGQEGGEEQIQLRSLDDDHQLAVQIPVEGTPEYEAFSKELPQEMQMAVQTGSLDEVNKVFATMNIGEAERVLEVFDRCQVIGINAYLEDENEFKEIQREYQEGQEETEGSKNVTQEIKEIKEEPKIEELLTADIVD